MTQLDPFDLAQLSEVVRICRRHTSLSAAGRELFAVSRQNRSTTNDADRLRKYLMKFGLSFDDLQVEDAGGNGVEAYIVHAGLDKAAIDAMPRAAF